ncbi:DNA lyase [Thermosipho melanesiensis]|uniref:8-oxoguanine DNA glycosylase/AP lyase n=2 Tax=Thermosipho melanesiensis TaxID=46541 RepID=A6LNZ5_THEM4|nr:N-glycosylase/DNA lyase [Thermosipho melanesiensis]ABR31646.1 DNA-(apurinic or apyrimidinic site) lyase [Thermosipho melanesiensis BI429]APT74675.1 DNA lyase [Thermosipho melanesiensis]OOC35172.1 DNA lyase [Thermosipho melanesiensis]OOC35382.1 DNA lyase [Thermosipho melanesiensis]OOC36633.1 DNA lyase [Thermosipho melanesiensis]
MIQEIRSIKDKAKEMVEERWNEFVELGRNGSEIDLFSELSFCVLTANWSAKGGIIAQKEIGEGFFTSDLKELENALRKVGHRFPVARARYIFENRWIVGKIRKILSLPIKDAREYLVKNVKGIGWKEASHFLRNVGICNISILDKHVLRLLYKYGYIEDVPKGWSKKKYLEIEKIFIDIAEKFEECPGKFDLYLWYYLKGKVEK